MSLALYTNSKDAWTAMFEGISNATSCIYIEMYIFSDDTKDTHNFVDLLCEKARAQVRVTMILDAIGSMYLSRNIIKNMKEAGVEIIFFRHWLHRTHRKLIIIDGTRALLGGVNITRTALLWDDLHVQVTGASVIDLLGVFARTYALAGGMRHILIGGKPYKNKKQKIRAWVLEHTPAARRSVLRKYYQYKIQNADKSIVCVTPYFVPDIWFVDAVRRAVKRGVSVQVIVPEQTDHNFMDDINRYFSSEVVRIGAHVYFAKAMNHAKAIIIDENEAMVGSANIDRLSFYHNSELGIMIHDVKVVHKLLQIFETWKQDAILFSETTHSITWKQRIGIFFIRLLTPIL